MKIHVKSQFDGKAHPTKICNSWFRRMDRRLVKFNTRVEIENKSLFLHPENMVSGQSDFRVLPGTILLRCRIQSPAGLIRRSWT